MLGGRAEAPRFEGVAPRTRANGGARKAWDGTDGGAGLFVWLGRAQTAGARRPLDDASARLAEPQGDPEKGLRRA
jgi:hypothetical protein